LKNEEHIGMVLSFIPRDMKVFAQLERLSDRFERLKIISPPVRRDHYRVIGNLRKLQSLEVRFNVVPAAALEDIGKLTELHTLKITVDCAGDERLEALAGLQKLERLELNTNGKFTDEGVLAIARLKKLWSFSFAVNEFTPAMGAGIAGMTGVHSIGVNCASASPEAFTKLSAGLQAPEIALLGAGISDENLAGFSATEGYHWINAPDTPLKQVFAPRQPENWRLTQGDDRAYTLNWTEEKDGLLLKQQTNLEVPQDAGTLQTWSVSPDRQTILIARNLITEGGKKRIRVGGLGLYHVVTGKKLADLGTGPVIRAGLLPDGRTVVFQQGDRVVEEDK
jgi:hypothetical protein